MKHKDIQNEVSTLQNEPSAPTEKASPVKKKGSDRIASTLLKRVGWFCLAIAVPVVFLAIQVVVIAVASVLGAASSSAEDVDALMAATKSINLPLVLAVAQAITIGVALPCWIKVTPGLKGLEFKGKRARCSVKSAAGIAMVGVGIQLLLGVILMLVYAAVPQVMEEYADTMKLMGLNALDPLTVAATVVLAPVVEELLFRGLCFAFAWRATGSVWAAVVLQALAFGAVHGNIVQGCYAFAIGIVLGFVYLKYRNIGICMLLHMCVNGSGVLVSLVPSWVPAFPYLSITLVASVILLVIGGRLAFLLKDAQLQKAERA